MQAEAEGVVALHDDFRNECAAQLCVGVVEEVRSILQQGYQLPRPLGGGIPLGSHKLLFVQLGLPELAGQLVAFGYKNVRINEAVLLEEGQRLILTGEFGYFFVEGNDVLAPEQSAITDRPEGLEHLLQNGEALMLELIVEAAEGFIRLRSGTGLMAQSPFSSCRQQHQYHLLLTCFARMREPQEQRIRTQSLPWVTACPTLRFCISVCTWSKVFRGMMGGCVPTA